MSRPADLPFATINYEVLSKGNDTRCEVLVDGVPIALLPARGITSSHDCQSIPRVEFSLLAESVNVQTVQVERGA